MRVYADADDLAAAARAELVRRGRDLIAARGRFTLALAGGSTPRALYERLQPDDLEWSRVVVLFGDERCVPPDHVDSNYRMARETLLDRVPVPAANVHRVRGELAPEAAADAYDAVLRETLPPTGLDLALLGLGADGHTASLFPGTPALAATERLAVVGRSPGFAGPPGTGDRVTLTLPALDAAAAAVFVVAGAAKAEAVAAVLRGTEAGRGLPAARVRPARVIWMLDREAASRLD